ncbi:hypothetical protein [Dyella humicola]|uniref:hypothetical protein n=1 Tax=Dyella humicola TaxID=2992126 RepID=UPI0022534164|nr:hypothetical protein [Dyella humicola]
MRMAIAVFAAVTLVGCATAGSLEERAPTFQASTTKTDKTYAMCVVAHWVRIAPAAHVVEAADGYRVIVPDHAAGVDELLVVRSRANGADVVLHERIEILAMRAYRDTARACL